MTHRSRVRILSPDGANFKFIEPENKINGKETGCSRCNKKYSKKINLLVTFILGKDCDRLLFSLQSSLISCNGLCH